MKKNYLLIAFSLFLLAACSPDREKQIAAIEKHESELSMLDVSVDEEKAQEMIGLYRQFVSDFPDDSLAPVYLMRVADISITLGETEQAVNVLDSIINIYPGFEDVPFCLFQKGYAYEASEQFDQARQCYQEFVDEYPDHYMAADTRKMLPYIGLSPEEMFEAIMNNATDQNLTMK
ncbi:MAG: tetratricopeptide repeat protein [Bacteroidales bacterium]|nr:tetratricopeptide repeat protein [Bacteroidales bacterium]